MTKNAGNVGRESLSYLHWIVENYETLDDDKCTCFSQGSINGFQMHRVTPYHFNTVRLPPRVNVTGIHSKQTNLHHTACTQNMYSRVNDMPCFPYVMHMIGKTPIRATHKYTTFASGYMIVRNKAIRSVPMFIYRRLIYGFIDQSLVCPQRSAPGELGFVMERFWKPLWSCNNKCTYTILKPKIDVCLGARGATYK